MDKNIKEEQFFIFDVEYFDRNYEDYRDARVSISREEFSEEVGKRLRTLLGKYELSQGEDSHFDYEDGKDFLRRTETVMKDNEYRLYDCGKVEGGHYSSPEYLRDGMMFDDSFHLKDFSCRWEGLPR